MSTNSLDDLLYYKFRFFFQLYNTSTFASSLEKNVYGMHNIFTTLTNRANPYNKRWSTTCGGKVRWANVPVKHGH
jgi:hypothetical protein